MNWMKCKETITAFYCIKRAFPFGSRHHFAFNNKSVTNSPSIKKKLLKFSKKIHSNYSAFSRSFSYFIRWSRWLSFSHHNFFFISTNWSKVKVSICLAARLFFLLSMFVLFLLRFLMRFCNMFKTKSEKSSHNAK